MNPDRMYSLFNQGVPYSRIAVMARDSLATVVNTITRLTAENQIKKNDRVTRMVLQNDGNSHLIRPVAVTLPRVSFIDGVAA